MVGDRSLYRTGSSESSCDSGPSSSGRTRSRSSMRFRGSGAGRAQPRAHQESRHEPAGRAMRMVAIWGSCQCSIHLNFTGLGESAYLHQGDGEDDAKVDAGVAPRGVPPGLRAGGVALEALDATEGTPGAALGEGPGPVADRVEAAAVEGILEVADGGAVLGGEEVLPAGAEGAVENGAAGEEVLQEEGGDGGGGDGLEGLEGVGEAAVA